MVDLPQWVMRGCDILDYIAELRPFRSRKITVEDLATSYDSVHFQFMLNGWNEISIQDTAKAQSLITSLDRGFPRAGIVIAGRTRAYRPPIDGITRARLSPLNRTQRRQYIDATLGDQGSELRELIERDRGLDRLTRTPLFLAEVAALYHAGKSIPSTKMDILHSVFQMVEDAVEHQEALTRGPLLGRARDYLSRLAMEMTANGGASIDEETSRVAVSEVAATLAAEGQISSLPEAATILEALCSHHVLERFDYPTTSYLFGHQQLQEYLVALRLTDQLLSFDRNDTKELGEFTLGYLNKPLWEEPIRMIAAAIGDRLKVEPDDEYRRAGAILVLETLKIDVVFASELAYSCGPVIWDEIGSTVNSRLREIHTSSLASSRHLALVAMLATGSADFSDIIVPLVTNTESQVRLRTLRAWSNIHLSSLGSGWRDLFATLEEEQRHDLLSELAFQGGSLEDLEVLIRDEASMLVVRDVLVALDFGGAEESVNRILREVSDEVFESVIYRLSPEQISEEHRPRALDVIRKCIDLESSAARRVNLRFESLKLGASDVIADLKSDLADAIDKGFDFENESTIRRAVELVRRADTAWASEWVAAAIWAGHVGVDRWRDLITTVPEELRVDALQRLSECHLDYREAERATSILAETADEPLAVEVFHKLCSIESEYEDLQYDPDREAIRRQLSALLTGMPIETTLTGILALVEDSAPPRTLEVIVSSLTSIGHEEKDSTLPAESNIRDRLRALLLDGIDYVLEHPDTDGSLKAHLAQSLSLVGDESVVQPIERLLQADIQRMEAGRAERREGRSSRVAQRALMSQMERYVQCLVRLESSQTENILLTLVENEHYEWDAARALSELCCTHAADDVTYGLHHDAIWQARDGATSSPDEDKRRRFADVIRRRITQLMPATQESESSEFVRWRLKRLAVPLASIDATNSQELILEVLSMPTRFTDGIDALHALLEAGARLDASRVIEIVEGMLSNPDLAYDQHREDRHASFLSVLPYLEPADEGIAKLRDVLFDASVRIGYGLRGILAAISRSRSEEGVKLLFEISSDSDLLYDSIRHEWFEALSKLDADLSGSHLLELLDPSTPLPIHADGLDTYCREQLSLQIAERANADDRIRKDVLSLCNGTLPFWSRQILADVVARMKDSESLAAGLALVMDDDPQCLGLPVVDRTFLHREYRSGGSYRIVPKSDDKTLAKLVEMASSDLARQESARLLLGWLAATRVECGRPLSEPRHPAPDTELEWPPKTERS